MTITMEEVPTGHFDGGSNLSEGTREGSGPTLQDLLQQARVDIDAVTITSGAHAVNHISGATDEVDGDKLDVDWNPSSYVPTIVAPATSIDHLTSHLKGIDLSLTTIEATLAARDRKDNVRLATAGALAAYTAAGSGVSKTLTANANGALTVDGVVVADGDRILVEDNGTVTAADRGIYTVTDKGSAGTPWILTRSTDANTSAKVTAGMFTRVEAGTANADTVFYLATDNPIVLDTTALSFVDIPNAHAATHIGGATDEVDGDNLDIDWTPAFYVPDATPVEAANVDSLTAHLCGIDTLVGTHATRHTGGAADEIDGDAVDIDWTPSTYTPDAAPAEAVTVDSLTAHLCGIDNELATLHLGLAIPAILRAVRVAGGTLSADGSENFTCLGASMTQAQVFATLTLGASLVITAEEPGTPGNAENVEVVDSGLGGLAVTYAAHTLSVDIGGAAPTEDQIAVAINVGAAAWTGILRATSGGGGAVGVTASAPLVGGVGTGLKVYAGGGLCTPVGEAGGLATSTASYTATTLQCNPPALTGLVPALQAADVAAIWVESNGVATQAISVVLV